DVDILTVKAGIAQAEGDLPRAAALLAPLHPNADDSYALQTQVYQEILERRPSQTTPRLKEILTKPDPALGHLNGELRAANWNLFSKNSRTIICSSDLWRLPI